MSHNNTISSDDITVFHDCHLFIPTRTIYASSEEYTVDGDETGFDGAVARRLIKNLHILDALDDTPITIMLQTLGGDLQCSTAVIDAIRASHSHIVVKVLGCAMSAGSLVLQAADERIMAPLATQMIHYGMNSCADTSTVFQRVAAEGRRSDSWMEAYYLKRIREKHPSFTLSKLQRLLSHDTYLTAQESVELGLADRVDGDNGA